LVTVEAATTLIGVSRGIKQVIAEAQAVAPTNTKILITGESGVGKEVLARLIYDLSLRRSNPMITINCAGLPETLLESELFGHVRGSFTDAHRDKKGLLELAHTGTILLDEVGEMTLHMQRMFLRFLETGEIQRVGSERRQTIVDVRVIAATNRDLVEQVRLKEFREDLYYRLNIVHLVIPPLRERRDDIPLLFEHFLAAMSREHAIPQPDVTPEAKAAIENYDWPGNVRELRNVVERVLLQTRGRALAVGDLPFTRNRVELTASGRVAQNTPEAIAAACTRRIAAGESFWTVVYEPFMLRDMTRETVRLVVQSGLEQTKGSYRLVAELFNLPSQDYKRFLNFLQKYDCHMPFQRFRVASSGSTPTPGSKRPIGHERSAAAG
jgi:transcriptional regulator with GAF, ATPase, and Fis domain